MLSRLAGSLGSNWPRSPRARAAGEYCAQPDAALKAREGERGLDWAGLGLGWAQAELGLGWPGTRAWSGPGAARRRPASKGHGRTPRRPRWQAARADALREVRRGGARSGLHTGARGVRAGLRCCPSMGDRGLRGSPGARGPDSESGRARNRR